MRWRPAIVASLLVLPLLYLLAVSFGNDPHAVPTALIGKPAPVFALKSLSGQPLGLEQLRGKKLLLNFWSTWCEPCKAEHELLQEAAKAYNGSVQFVGIVYQDTADAAREYLGRRTSIYAQLLDEDSKVAIDYGVAGVPETYIIDEQGTIVFKQAGVMTPELLQKTLGAVPTL